MGTGVAWKKERTPHRSRLLTQRALLAHGVLVLERVVRELRRVVRGRVTVAGRPVEGDCAVSCERGRQKHSVRGETGPEPGYRSACPNPSPPYLKLQRRVIPPHLSPELSAGSRAQAPMCALPSEPAPRLFSRKTLTSPPFPNSFMPLSSSTLPDASKPNLGQVKYENRRESSSPKTNTAALTRGQRRRAK